MNPFCCKQRPSSRAWLLVAFSAAWLSVALPVRAERLVRACGGDAEWVPSSFFVREQGRKTERVTGYSVDVLRAALPADYRLEVNLMPWLRCLKEVEYGKRYQIAMGLIANEARTRVYRFSEPYQAFQPGYFYWRERRPDGVPLQSLADLSRFRVCGLLGFNYDYSGLPGAAIDTGAMDYPSLMAKLAAGRCELGLEMREVLAGRLKLGVAGVAANALLFHPLSEIPPVKASFGISRNDAQSERLLRDLDEGIARLRRQQRLKIMLDAYLSHGLHGG
ncbi:substrate-binding periplasmic protein [Chitinimonas sp.]|uniref:substrate-binding periplasmic protein n=1 Tax=Chitinimonas sp. TaxID=1934313 RepID=UPI0035B157E9